MSNEVENQDELLTEREALKQAAEQGITFVDKFYVIEVGKFPTHEDEYFDNIKKAQKELEKKGDNYNIVTVREQSN